MITKIEAFNVTPLGVSGKTVIGVISALEACRLYVRAPASASAASTGRIWNGLAL